MKVIRFITLLFACLLFTGALSAHAETSAAQRAQIEAARNLVEELNSQQTPDTVFQFNTGLDKPKAVAGSLNKIISPEAQDLADVDLDSFHAVQVENAETRLNQQFEEKGKIRREQTQKIDQKHKRYEKLETEISANQAKAQQRLDAALEQKAQRQGKSSAKLDAEIKQQSRRVNKATVKQQQVSVKKAELGKSRSTAKYLKIRQEIAATKSKLAAMEKAMQRKAKFDKGSAILGVVLTAISSEMEENALAQQEGRQPLAANKVINFAKNISGYSTIKGVMDNVEMAKMEAMVSTMEFFEANGFDLDDPETQKLAMQRAEDAARRAVARTAIYEGAKLAPVVSDLVSIKEGFDAAGEAYVASEEAAYITAGNEQAQFQTSLRGAVNIEAKVRQMEAIAERTRVLTSSLGKLKGQLLTMEQNAEANRDQVGQAVKLLNSYNLQAEAIRNPAVSAELEPANIDALLGRLKAVKDSADQQVGNMQRVKAEHQSGQLTAQGVATQARFIGDLLQPAIADHAALQPVLTRIESLGRGSEVAAQVPATIEFLHQAKAVMQQQGERSNQLYELYRDQAVTLEQLAKQFQELRGEMPRFLAYVQSSKNLEDPHQDKIRAALDRANNADIDQTALRRVIDDARGLRNSAGLVGALASLDKVPQTIDAAKVDALVQRAQQAWAKLSDQELVAAQSLQNAQNLLNQLVALARNAKPVKVGDTKPDEALDRPRATEETVAGGSALFSGVNALDLSDEKFDEILTNEKGPDFLKDPFLGFKVYNYKKQGIDKTECRNSSQGFCPWGENELIKIVEQGETVRTSGQQKGKVPYWIAFVLHGIGSDLDQDYHSYERVNQPLLERSAVKNNLDSKTSRHYKISLPNADEAIAIDKPSIFYVHARKGPLRVSASGRIVCAAGGLEPTDGKTRYSSNQQRGFNGEGAAGHPDQYVKEYGEDFVESCAEWHEGKREIILGKLANELLAEARPILSIISENFYFRPIEFKMTFPGFSGDRELTRKWQAERGQYRTEFYESYTFSILEYDPEHRESWKQTIGKIEEKIDADYKKGVSQPDYESRGVNIAGANHTRMWSKREHYPNRTIPEYRFYDYIQFRIGNVWVSVKGNVLSDQDKTRTVEFANAVAGHISSIPKGWQ